MSLARILEAVAVDRVTTVNCDWIDDKSLTVRGFPKPIQYDTPVVEGNWLVPGTWWLDEKLLIFEKQNWNGAIAEWKGRTLTWEEGGIKLIIVIPATVEVRSVTPDEFWYPELPKIGGALPDFPIRQPYVRLLKHERGWVDQTWTGTSTNELEFTNTWNRNKILDQDADHPLIAVWPPHHIPGWKLYSILLQGLRVVEVDTSRPGFRITGVSLSSSPESGPSAFVTADQTENRYVDDRPDIMGIESDRGSPRALFLTDDRNLCGGGIRLLRDSVGRSAASKEIAVDFGTSHSVVRWYDENGQAVSALTLRDGWTHPLVARSVTPPPPYEFPWLLGSPAPDYEKEQADEITFIPTGLYLRAANIDAQTTDNWEKRLPFVDYCLMGPAMDFEKRAEVAMSAWRSGLKWSDRTGAARAFLVGLLVWAVAARKGTGGTVRFSAPLAFSNSKRKMFGQMLKEACERAGALTGTTFTLPSPCFTAAVNEGAAKEPPPRPFVDEATPVIWEVIRGPLKRHVNEIGEGRHGVLVADLGGGTLDLLLASLNTEGEFRLLASESVQFGARAVIEMVDRKIQWTIRNQPAGKGVDPKLKEALLEQWARTGELTEAILETSRTPDAGTAFVREETAHWAASPRASALAIMNDVCGYFFLIREYCARFVAGVLSSPDFKDRFKQAPGSDATDWGEGQAFSMAIALTGNGWRFLALAGFNTRDQAKMEDDVRGSIRARVGEYLHQAAPGNISLSEFIGLRKLITAQGMLSLECGEEDRTIEVAPNGCVDIVKTARTHWGAYVSSADTSYKLPPRQGLRNVEPDLAGTTDNWFKLCAAVQDPGRTFRKAGWFAPSEVEWNDLTSRQSGIDRRDIPTIRALWETVIRKRLELAKLSSNQA